MTARNDLNSRLRWTYFTGVMLLFFISVGCGRPGNAGMVVTAEGGLKMREAPDANARVLALVPNRALVEMVEQTGDETEIAGKKGRWTKIRFLDATGWAFGGFLSDAVSEERKIDLHEVFRNGESITFVYEDTGTMNGTCTAYSWKLHADGSVSAENLHCTGFECGYNISNGRWAIADDSLTITATGTTPPDCVGFSQEQLDYRFESFRRKDVHIANRTHKSFEILGPEKAK
ncbi:MAG: hypothetical protein CVV45_06520 [Spirochaetae bacterium HGW-Spirochaetae-10]|nr:MAG: hypothetical protein CVV45_06520 [Spirochaetae bacterium HGW-Spirochaetae-10]